jgi:hypothetical protein
MSSISRYLKSPEFKYVVSNLRSVQDDRLLFTEEYLGNIRR